ncbi:MAG: hypothetical protein HW403_1177 [Dehalococcoidia bacterium]|nr:hypothetical protein [Dehalococcoidia bacterium]
MITEVACKHALKEWAVTIKALDEGKQVLLMRKGGIREKQFKVEHEEFFLYPTYEHQRSDLLKDEFHRDLVETMGSWGGPDEKEISFTHWVQVTNVYEIMEPKKIEALSSHYIWTPDYIEKRLYWRPKMPLEVMLVRAYRLPTAHTLEISPYFLGCKSWVDMDEPLPLGELTPVLSDDEYREMAERVVRAIS